MSDRIYLEVNGIKYDGFKSISYRKSLEELSGTFNFVATSELRDVLSFIGQEKCRIVLGDRPLITGFIENLEYRYSESDHVIQIAGRDKTSDIIDSTIVSEGDSEDLTGNIDFAAPISLTQIISRTLSQVGITGISVINTVVGLEDFTAEEMVVAKDAENLFDFFDKYARKRGVILTSDGDGNIRIIRGGGNILPGILVNQINGTNNNIKSASINYDFTKRFYKYVVKSQANPSVEQDFEGDDLSGYEGTIGIAYDDEVRKSRIIELGSETVAIPKTNQERAEWEANIRRTRSLVYKCSVTSLYTSDGSDILEPGKRIRVSDDMCKINSIMIIRSVNYSLSENGTQVDLEMVPNDSYTLESSRNPKEIKYDQIGDGIILPKLEIVTDPRLSR